MSDPLPKIKIKKLYVDSLHPQRAFPTDSGLDLFIHHFEKIYGTANESIDISMETDYLVVMPNERVFVNTGISATVGPGYELQIRPRSGLALKQGITVVNTPGTVDEQYRGPINIILINHSGMEQKLEKKMKIAQMVACPVALLETEFVEELSSTERSAGGFGHTGV